MYVPVEFGGSNDELDLSMICWMPTAIDVSFRKYLSGCVAGSATKKKPSQSTTGL